MKPSIRRIFICEAQGKPMQSHERIKIISDVGLDGDKADVWPEVIKSPLHYVSFIEQEIINALCNEGVLFTMELVQCNIITEHIRLDTLVGKLFRISESDRAPILYGKKLCSLHDRVVQLSGGPIQDPKLQTALQNRTSLLATIIAGGTITEGEPLYTGSIRL